MRTPRRPLNLPSADEESRARLKNIRTAVRAEDAAMRESYPWLKHQNTIGALLLLLSVASILALGVAFYNAVLPAWCVVIGIAIACSILHELEHDLIHRTYFRDNPIAYHTMFAVIWMFKPNTVSPWYRKKIHIHHHTYSGTFDDIEERILGNGFKYNFKRLITMIDPAFSGMYLHAKEINRMPSYSRKHFGLSMAPFYFAYVLLRDAMVLLLALYAAEAVFGFDVSYAWLDTLESVVWFLAVVWVLPNMLRGFCLYFVTSTLHYYGDVRTVEQQTQILTHWVFWPFHLFCFNFGGTHAIHHLVVNQPFYLRQMTAKAVYPVLRENGVRFNDFGTFKRVNRWGDDPEVELKFE